MENKQGIIIKAISGFFYVEAGDAVYECKARGHFRKDGITPLVGDTVTILPGENFKGVIGEILPRNNFLERPPIANIDRLLIVAASADPKPNTLVLDRLTAIAEDHEIEPVIVINKTDLQNADWLKSIYDTAGIETHMVSCVTGEGIEELKQTLIGKINVFSGNSGVGKSSLLNRIDPQFKLPTGEISEKLGRGRHTTRHVELYKLPAGGYVADTPGFSSVDMEKCGWIVKENLPFAFREFLPFLSSCRFSSCSHTGEKGCAICKAVKQGKIHESRHNSYVALYKEAEAVKDWQRK